MTHASFPAIRMRRTRAAAWSRAMFAENRIGPQDLIWPLFVTEGKEVEEPVSSLPGVSRWSVDLIVARAREARDAGIPCLALFPNTPPEKRSADGKEALNPDNLMCRATKAIKDAVPDIGILTDVALDPYTSHGQDGLIDANGYVLNDANSEVLTGAGLGDRHDGAPQRGIELRGFWGAVRHGRQSCFRRGRRISRRPDAGHRGNDGFCARSDRCRARTWRPRSCSCRPRLNPSRDGRGRARQCDDVSDPQFRREGRAAELGDELFRAGSGGRAGFRRFRAEHGAVESVR